jgi:hypothetical protein
MNAQTQRGTSAKTVLLMGATGRPRARGARWLGSVAVKVMPLAAVPITLVKLSVGRCFSCADAARCAARRARCG